MHERSWSSFRVDRFYYLTVTFVTLILAVNSQAMKLWICLATQLEILQGFCDFGILLWCGITPEPLCSYQKLYIHEKQETSSNSVICPPSWMDNRHWRKGKIKIYEVEIWSVLALPANSHCTDFRKLSCWAIVIRLFGISCPCKHGTDTNPFPRGSQMYLASLSDFTSEWKCDVNIDRNYLDLSRREFLLICTRWLIRASHLQS